MILLFDQNISSRIIRLLEGEFPGCTQVTRENLTNAKDSEIWEYAGKNQMCIVTFDSDFLDLLTVRSFPPKVMLLRFGNTSTNEIASILSHRKLSIESFLGDSEIGGLEIHL